MAIALEHDGRACCLDIGSATCSPVRRVRAKLVFLLFNVYILSTCFVHIGYNCDTAFYGTPEGTFPFQYLSEKKLKQGN